VLTFEDDGKVAYAYLKRGNQVVSAVWLYNRCVDPGATEWANPENIPFANHGEYLREEGRLQRVVQPDDVQVEWENEDGEATAYVYIFGDLYGILGTFGKLGHARFALKDGPLALKMVVSDESP
jgi:hypothetical protein